MQSYTKTCKSTRINVLLCITVHCLYIDIKTRARPHFCFAF